MEIDIKTNQAFKQDNLCRQAQPSQPSEVSFFQLFRYADKIDYLLMAIGTFGAILFGAINPAVALLTGSIINTLRVDNTDTAGSAKEKFYQFLIIGGFGFFVGIMYFCWMVSGKRQTAKCRKKFFESLTRQEIAWFDLQQEEVLTTFEQDTNIYQQAVGEKISSFIMVISMVVVGIGISLYYGWILTLVLLGYLPLVVYAWVRKMNVGIEIIKEQDEVYNESDMKVEESLSAIKLVKQMNAEQFETSTQWDILQRVRDLYNSTIVRYVLASGFAVLTLLLVYPLAFWYSGECVFDTEKCPSSISSRAYTAGTTVTILNCLLIPAISFNQLFPCIRKVSDGKAAATRMFAVIDRVPLVMTEPDAIIPETFSGEIEFVGVSFAYPKNKSKKILDKVSILFDCRHAAIVGPSGEGKSTIFQLIMRFYDPDEGTIFLDGVDIRQVNLEWLRTQIGYVTQEPVLFATSIRENLLLSKQNASDLDIEVALRKAEAFSFVNKLSNGLDTYSGSGGSQLSGGQKQRIAIARMFLKEPQLVLMDEALSHLDHKNEKKILKTLKLLQKEYILISITHRKRILANCDKVFRFEPGSITKVTHKRERKQTQKRLKNNLKIQVDGKDKQLKTEFMEISETLSARANKIDDEGTTVVMSEKSVEFPEDKQQNNPHEKIPITRILPYLLKKKCLFALGVLFAVVDGVIFPTLGIFLARVIASQLLNQLNPSYYWDQILLYAYISLGLAVVGTFTGSLSLYFFGLLSQHSVNQLRMDVFRKTLNMPIFWFEQENNHPEVITSDITVSCKKAHNFVATFLPLLLSIAVNICFSLVLAVYFEWRTGLTACGVLPLLIISQIVQVKLTENFSDSKNQTYNNSVQIVKESVTNIRTVFSLGAPPIMQQRYNYQLDRLIAQLARKAIISGILNGVAIFIMFFSFGIIIYLGIIYIEDFNLPIDGVLEAIFLIFFASFSIINNSSYMPDLSSAKQAVGKLFFILDQEDQYETREKAGCKHLKEPIKGNIEFVDVDFKFENRENLILNSCSFRIEQGQSVGIVGMSGSGKSTIFALLQGFYSPTGGRILLQGIDINDYDLRHLRSSLAVVSQEPTLFNESISWNIRYNMQDIKDDQIIWAARAASFDPSFEKIDKPDYNVNQISKSAAQLVDENPFSRTVGPKGSHVSGGQRQRIAIARALIRNPQVLMLDEATSALDADNEERVLLSIKDIMNGKTTIHITHHLEQTEKMDKIFTVNQGRIEEEGQYDDLRLTGGKFSMLIKVSSPLRKTQNKK